MLLLGSTLSVAAQNPYWSNYEHHHKPIPKKHKKRGGENKEFNDSRHFDLGLTFMIPLNDNTDIFGFDFGFGYEFVHPKFEYIGVKPNIGFNLLTYESDKTMPGAFDEHNVAKPVVDPDRFKLDNYGFYFGLSATFYLPFHSGSVESLYLANDFNWLLSRMQIAFPEKGSDYSISKSSRALFFYSIKLGLRAIPLQSEKLRASIWVGFTTLDLRKEVSRAMQSQRSLADIQPHLIFGFNLLF